MESLIEKLGAKTMEFLILKELKWKINNGSVSVLFFPEHPSKKFMNPKNDYVEKAIRRGYKLDKNTRKYILNNPKYVDLFVKVIRIRITQYKYKDLDYIPSAILEKIGTRYIMKAIDNGYELKQEKFDGFNSPNILNIDLIKYYIFKTKSVSILNKTPIETLRKLSNQDTQLMCKYMDIAMATGVDVSFALQINTDYILYFISRAKHINDELLYLDDATLEKIYNINPDVIKMALKKGADFNIKGKSSKFILDHYEDELMEKIYNDILTGRYRNKSSTRAYFIDEEILELLSKRPDYIVKLIEQGCVELIWLIDYKKEYLKAALSSYYKKGFLEKINSITGKNYRDYEQLLSVNEDFNKLLFTLISNEIAEEYYDIPFYNYNDYYLDDIKDKLFDLIKVTKINGVNIDFETLVNMSDNLISKYKTKVVTQLQKNELFSANDSTKKAMSNVICVFGLFEEDKIGRNIRLNRFNQIINKIPVRIDEWEYNQILSKNKKDNKFIEDCFVKITGKKYVKKQDKPLPACLEGYSSFLGEELSERQYKLIRKMLPSGTIGSELNKYLRSVYEEVECIQYEIKKDLSTDKLDIIRNMMQKVDIDGMITYQSLQRIFSGCLQDYSNEFYEFIIENINMILLDSKNQRNIKEIQKKFESIKKECAGEKVTYAKAVECVNRVDYDQNYDEDFISILRKAEVSDISAAEYYWRLHLKASGIEKTSLPNYEREYTETINGEVIRFRARRLEKRDPLLVLVGESGYTNCCQSYEQPGQTCNVHSATSQEGGVFVTEVFINDKWVLLTQSWDWVNNSVYCHDNIEGTNLARKYGSIIEKMYIDHAKYVLEISRRTTEEYIEENDLTVEQLEQAKRQIIALVTVGTSNNDIRLSNYKQVNNPVPPLGYSRYRDSDTQLILAGSEEDVIDTTNINVLYLYREKHSIRKNNLLGIKNKTEIGIILDLLKNNGLNISDYYGENTNVIYTDNWTILYEVNDNIINIGCIALKDDSTIYKNEIYNVLKELLNTYKLGNVSEQVMNTYIYQQLTSENSLESNNKTI